MLAALATPRILRFHHPGLALALALATFTPGDAEILPPTAPLECAKMGDAKSPEFTMGKIKLFIAFKLCLKIKKVFV